MGVPDDVQQSAAVGTVREVRVAVAVGRAESRDGRAGVGQGSGDGALAVLALGRVRVDEPGLGVVEEVVDVPVADVAVAGGDLAVAVDAPEAAGAERAPRVRVVAGVEAAVASGANRAVAGAVSSTTIVYVPGDTSGDSAGAGLGASNR